MYNVRWLYRVARQGLDDLVPAIRQAFNDDPGDDRLERVYGRPPRRNILLLTLAGIVVGALATQLLPEFPFSEQINWGAVVLGVVHAGLVRRYLFRDETVSENDFPWLAASLAPAAVALSTAGSSSATTWTGPASIPPSTRPAPRWSAPCGSPPARG